MLAAALNAVSTADAGTRCLRFGTAGGARAIVVARPGVDVRDAVTRGSQLGTGPVVVRASTRSCAVTFWVDPQTRTLAVPGWTGSVRSDTTRFDGLVAATDVADAVRGKDVLHGGGRADVDALRARLERTHDERIVWRIVLVAIMLGLALVAPRRALMAGPAAISAALLLAWLDWKSAVLFGALTLLLSFAPRRALWIFFGAYLVVLAARPETASLAVLGPHPEGGGRFYGVTNEAETLILAPALWLGLAAAPLVLVLVAWSRAGADGGGALVFLSSYAALLPKGRPSNRLLLAYGLGILAIGLALVGLDAATGGHSHVTTTIGDGPGAVWHTLTHRWSVSWHGAFGRPGRGILDVLLLAALVAVALRRPRKRLLDAFLVGIAVSLLVNDTPQDVLLWGTVQALALRRAV